MSAVLDTVILVVACLLVSTMYGIVVLWAMIKMKVLPPWEKWD